MKIALVGAYGFTGRLICLELQKAEISFDVYGRSKEKLENLRTEFPLINSAVPIDLRTQEGVEKVISQSDVIINCAGPFTEESDLLLKRVAENSKIYIDITGEIGFVKSSYERFHDIALNTGALILHGCTFESLFADLAIRMAISKLPNSSKIRTFYHFNQGKVSPGTRITMKLSKFRETLKIKNSSWSQSDLTKDQLKVSFEESQESIAIPYPLPEIAFSFWNYATKQAESFLLIEPSAAKFLVNMTNGKGTALEILDKIRYKKPVGPSKEERAAQRSMLLVNVEDDLGNSENIALQSSDMYLSTARAVLLVLKKIMVLTKRPKGVISPAQLFKNQENEVLLQLDAKLLDSPNLSITNM